VSISPLSIFYFLSFFGKVKLSFPEKWLAFSFDIAGFAGGLGFLGAERSGYGLPRDHSTLRTGERSRENP